MWVRVPPNPSPLPLSQLKLGWFSLFFESPSHRPDAGESSFDIVDDLLRELGEPFVFEPEKIEDGFVAGDQLGAAEFPPAARPAVMLVG